MCPHGRPGHYVAWLRKPAETLEIDGTKKYLADIRIAHAHFIIGRDQGRHVDDTTQLTIWIPEDQLIISARIPPKFYPDWYLQGSD
jgi:hypothetical protein